MESFAHELRIDFPIRLENPHVIANEQVFTRSSFHLNCSAFPFVGVSQAIYLLTIAFNRYGLVWSIKVPPVLYLIPHMVNVVIHYI
jgi:hypothetical protein